MRHVARLSLLLALLLLPAPLLIAGWKTDAYGGARILVQTNNKTITHQWRGDKDADGYATGPGLLTVVQYGKLVATYNGTMTRGVMSGYVKAYYYKARKCYFGEITDFNENGEGAMYDLDSHNRPLESSKKAGRWIDGEYAGPAPAKDGIAAAAAAAAGAVVKGENAPATASTPAPAPAPARPKAARSTHLRGFISKSITGAFLLANNSGDFSRQEMLTVVTNVPEDFLEVDGTMVDVYCDPDTKRPVRFDGQVHNGMDCISIKKIPGAPRYGVDMSSPGSSLRSFLGK